jgi:hypothetical protein
MSLFGRDYGLTNPAMQAPCKFSDKAPYVVLPERFMKARQLSLAAKDME